MKKFRSRLQSLQRLRDQQEQLARARVAACQQQLSAVSEQILHLQQDLDETSQAMHTLLSQQPGAETVNGSRALYHRGQAELTTARQQQHTANAALAQALEQWHATRAELKAISNRIDSQRAVHRRETFLQEEHRQQETTAQTRHQRATEISGEIKS